MRITRFAVGALALALSTHASLASDAADREDLATRMIAVGYFVDQVCPNMSVNKPLLAAAMRKLDIDVAALAKKQARMNQVGVLTAGWEENPKVACAAAWQLYGDDGSLLPGMLERE